jgi:aryl-alcohol dehydrogenase-like predicted oxidoreductase
MNKLALGTVQWGINYGISYNLGVPSDLEIKKILKFSKNNGIKLLDTASTYGNSELRIKKLANQEFSIITKISSISNENSIKKQINNSLNRLGANSIYGCLFHSPNELIKNNHYWEKINEEKINGKVKKIGYSLYHPNELDYLLNSEFIPDIVQIPYSILDRKFESYFKILNKLKIEIHIRSVFLQGLYFLNPNNLPKKLKDYTEPLNKLNKLANDYSLEIIDIALNYVLNKNYINHVVIGVVNVKQIEDILFSSNKKLNKEIINIVENIKVNNKDILNPSNW